MDCETRGLQWWNPEHQTFLITWTDADGDFLVDEGMTELAFTSLRHRLERADVIVCHNAPFDVHHIREAFNIDILAMNAQLVDTNQLARVVLPERRLHGQGYTLDELSRALLHEDDQKIRLAEIAKAHGINLKADGGYYDLWQASPRSLEDYAMQDTAATYALYFALLKKLKPELQRVWEIERDVQPHLIRAEQRGVLVDQAKIGPLKTKYLAQRDAAYARVVEALGDGVLGDLDDPDSKDSPGILRERLLEHGVPLYRTTDKGVLSTNKGALQEFRRDFPVVDAIFEYRNAAKFLATYIGPMEGRDVVHPSFWQQGAWTGRMSCSNPNMQNIPVRGEGASELREMFVPRPGHCFVISDFDSIELRLLAYYLNDPAFIAKVEAGVDLFAELAAELWGGSPEDYHKGTPGAGKRSEAKNATYAIVYGVGARKLSDMLGLPAGPPMGPDEWMVQRGFAKVGDPSWPEGRRIIQTVKSWLPGYGRLMGDRTSRIKTKIANTGYVSTLFGRRQPISPDKSYVGLSGLIQGSAADIMKQAVVDVAEAVRPYGAQPVLFVHDELVTECPVEHAERVLKLQDIHMMNAAELRPRLKVSGTIAYNNYAEGK